MPLLQETLERIASDLGENTETKGSLIAWTHRVTAWSNHDAIPALYRQLAYETLKAWLNCIPISSESRQELQLWLIAKLRL